MIVQSAKRLNAINEYYFSGKLAEIRTMNLKGAQVINLGIGSPDLPPSEQTTRELVRTSQKADHHGYQSYKGIQDLRKAICQFTQKTYGVHLDPEQEVLPLIGSKEGITHISLAFLDPGDGVLIPDPGYPTYASVTKMIGGIPLNYNLNEHNNWLPDLGELKKIVNSFQGNVKLMWLNYPHMPTGAEGNIKAFEDLVAFAKKHKLLLCHDNPYSLVLNKTKPLSLLKIKGSKEVAIELNSMSKSFNMAGWRIGWMAGSKDHLNTILKVKSNVDSGMFLPVQKAACKALNNSHAWHLQRNQEYKRRRKKAGELLELLNCDFSLDQSGMFIWAKIPAKYKSSEQYCDKILQNARVFITPGFIFGKNGEGYLRVSLCSSTEMFDRSIKRIKKMLSNAGALKKKVPA